MSQGTVLMMAGGTGGHVVPALTVAREMSSRGYQILWLGTKTGIEARLVPEAGFEIKWLDIGGLRGKGWKTRLLAPIRLIKAVLQARAVIRESRPVLAVGMGGFASGPGGLAAWLMQVPLVIHEQNAVAGLTNRVLARVATRVLSAYAGVFKQRHEVVGNPVRAEITALAPPAERFAGREGPLRVLVLGGSLGAVALNEIVPAALSQWSHRQPLAVRHQCGPRNLAQAEQSYRQHPLKNGSVVEVLPYIDDMADAYGWADLVIARAGALTLAELAAAGLGSVLVPYPHAVDDHQTVNGAALVEAGAAIMIQQRDLSAQGLAQMLSNRLSDRQTLLSMAEAARQVAHPDALDKLVSHCESVIRRATRKGEAT